MKILLDECVDHRLKTELCEHDVQTVPEMGWAGIKNGELLKLAAQEFDVMITVDKRMAEQQDEVALGLPVIILYGRSIRLKHLKSLVPLLLEKLAGVLPVQFHHVGTAASPVRGPQGRASV